MLLLWSTGLTPSVPAPTTGKELRGIVNNMLNTKICMYTSFFSRGRGVGRNVHTPYNNGSIQIQVVFVIVYSKCAVVMGTDSSKM